MAEGNLLEIVLSQDVEKKFDAIDERLESIQKNTKEAVDALGKFSDELKANFGSMMGVVAGLLTNIEKLSEATAKMGTSGANGARDMAASVVNAATQLDKLYNQRLQYENKIAQLETKKETYGMQGKAIPQELTDAIAGYEKLIGNVNKKIGKAIQQHIELYRTAKQTYDTKAAEQQLANEERRQKAIERTEKAMKRLADTQAKNAQKDFNASLGISIQPKTIEQYRIAIQNLKREIDKLSPDDKAGIAGLTKRLEEYKQKLGEAGATQQRFTQQANKLKSSMLELASAFGVGFSLSSMVNFGKKVVEITGEFELQHRAMQAIIGDMDAANKLWDKTISLAVKSPYRVKDLVTYTKELAAYRVETDKLYDTTKMLADISSGLGVDMQRLILAYGQVKAANYLRGQELRQFSEAGVNILGELANYFSELQGRAISTGEVFEMVSKRMVKFEDVATVLHRLTEEGGIFFNMQEIQAETLQGKIMNLRDSYDIMMNSMGESKRTAITTLVDSAKYLLDNWQSVGNTLKWVTGLIVGVRIALNSLKISMTAQQAVTSGTTIQMTLLTRILSIFSPTIRQAAIGTKGFSMALKSIPGAGVALAVITALTGVLSSLIGKMKQAREFQEQLGKISTESSLSTSKMTNTYIELANKIKSANTSESERKETLEKMNRLYRDILPNRLLEIEYIKKEGNAYTEALEGIRAYYQEKRKEQQIEATEKEYGGRVGSSEQAAANRLQKQIKNYTGVEVSLRDINTVMEKLSEQMRNGEIESDKFASSLVQLIKIQTGLDLNLPQLDHARYEIILHSYEQVKQYLEDILDYDQQLMDVTSSNDFGGTGSAAFDNLVTKPAENAIAEYSEHLEGTFQEQGRQLAEYSKKSFEKYWEEFKKSPFYKDNPDMKTYFENLFEQKIKPKIDSSQVTSEIDKINQKFDEAAAQIKVTNNGIFKEFLYDGKKSTSEYLADLTANWENTKLSLREINGGLKIVSPEEKKKLEDTESVLGIIVQWLKAILEPNKSVGRSGNKALETLNKQIEAIKNASKQYEEYKKLYDDTTAYKKTKEAVQDLFGDLGISGLLSKSGIFEKATIKDQLDSWLAGQMARAGKDGRIAVEKYVRELGLQAEQADFKEVVDGFRKSMDAAFSDYDMYKELEKLGIGKDFASILFGVDTTNINELEREFEIAKEKLLSVYDGDEAKKAVEEMQKKIDEAEDKAQKERLKKYVEYTKQAMTERAKIEVEGLQEIAEIEKTFQKEIEKAQSNGNAARAEQIEQLMKTAIEGSKRTTSEKLQKQAWDDFKSSDLYIEMFNDIDNASTKVITEIQEKIRQLKNGLKDLNPSDLRAITQEINKLEDELIKRNPMQSFFKYFKEVNDLQKKGLTENRLSENFIANENDIENLNALIAGNEKLLKMREQMSQEEIDAGGGAMAYYAQNNALRSQIAQWKAIIDQKRKDNTLTQEQLDLYKKFRSSTQEFSNYLQGMGQRIGGIFSDIMSNLEAFGGETNNTTEAWGGLFQSIMSIVAMIPNYILLMKAAGVAANEALGVVGWIITGVEVLVSLIKGIAGLKDARIDDEIEDYQKKVDKLANAYERVEKLFDKAWNTDALVRYREEMEKNIQQQIRYINAQIKAEESRKNPDQAKIDDWEKAITELTEDLSDKTQEFFEQLGGIGKDSYKDAAEDFVDAWLDAYKETGDGLEGLREHFNEIITNMVKKQAVMRLSETLMKPLFSKIDQAAADGIVSSQEMAAINSFAEEELPKWNEALKNFAASLGFFGGQAENELSGLQKGIQGVTEETAEIIAAYLNSIRFYVIDNNTKLGQVIAALRDNTGQTNPMLNELRNLRMRTDDIYNFLWQRREDGSDSMRVYVVN